MNQTYNNCKNNIPINSKKSLIFYNRVCLNFPKMGNYFWRRVYNKFCSKLLLSLLIFLTQSGCGPQFEFWIVNKSTSEYKLEILFKKKYNLEGFNALFGYKLEGENSLKRTNAVIRTPVPSYDDMFFLGDNEKKIVNRITEVATLIRLLFIIR